jgi:hypothetical protein
MKQDGSPSRQHDTAGGGSIRGEDRPECARQVGFGPLDWFRPQASCDNLIDSPFSDDAPFARLAAVVSQDGTSASERSA